MKILFSIFNSFCLLIVAFCSVAFIYLEYKPTISNDLQINKIQNLDPLCNSRLHTEKYKREVIHCF